MTGDPITLLASAEQAASANGSTQAVNEKSALVVVVDVTAQSGTWGSGKWAVWLETSVDGGTTWSRMVADTVVQNWPDKHKTADVTVSANAPFLVSVDAAAPTLTTYTGTYTNFGDSVRARWIVDGTTPRVTFSVKGIAR